MRIALSLVLASFLMVPTFADAAPLTVGDIVITDGIGTTDGGEFNMFVNGSAQSFVTFCLQRNQSIGFNQPFRVGGVTDFADDAGGNDPISLETQWLYQNIREGTLTGYTHTNAMADLLQTAIWHFEDEISLTKKQIRNNDFIKAAAAAVDHGYKGSPDVKVLNLFYMNGAKAQDQVVMQVPGPAALTLLVPGVAALAFMRRRHTLPPA